MPGESWARGKWKVEERRNKKSSVSGMCNLVFVCILNIAMGDMSDILEQTELRCCFTVLHSDTEGSEICVNMRLCLALLTLSGLCHGLYYKVFALLYGVTLRHWGGMTYEAFYSTADAK